FHDPAPACLPPLTLPDALPISPVLGREMKPEEAVRGAYLRPPFPVEFMHLFDNREADLRVSTAVRLSATFPFVSPIPRARRDGRSEEHTSELQSRGHLVCRLLL